MLSVPDAFLANSDVSGAADLSQRSGWQRELALAVRSGEELLQRLGLNPDDPQTQQVLQAAGIQLADQDTLRRFPVLVPENFLARMTPGDLHDPLLRQVLPLAAESLVVDGSAFRAAYGHDVDVSASDMLRAIGAAWKAG